MAEGNIVQEKAYKFSLNTIQMCRYLMDTKKEYIISKQLCKSGTSIGANIEDGLYAPSKKDFVHKLSISLKEARESHYWIRLLRDSAYAPEKEVELSILLKDLNEIIALLTSIIKSSRLTLP